MGSIVISNLTLTNGGMCPKFLRKAVPNDIRPTLAAAKSSLKDSGL